MIEGLIRLSLRFRGVIVALACLFVGYGLLVASRSKLDVFPDFVPPQVSIQTEAPGLAPEEVEALVTRPVETAINGLGGQAALRSESIQGLSVITVIFQQGTDLFRSRQMLAEKLSEIGSQLPIGVKQPKLTPLTSSTMDLLKIGLVSDKMNPMELRTFADWTLKPRLLGVAGVAKCSTFGGDVRQLQIQVDPDRLQAHGLAISDVQAAARLATGVRGAGYLETENQRIILQTEGQALQPAQLGEVILIGGTNGAVIRLRDVAKVVEAAEPKFGDALVMGRAGVLMTMSSQYGANTLEVTRALEKELDGMKPLFAQQGIVVYPRMHRPASFIEAALHNMGHSLLLGAIFVAVVLFIFLGHFRTAFISLTAIPLSLLTAVVVLEKLGITLNTMTLGGLAIAIGEVVDDAIIDVENIFRRLQENNRLATPRSVFNVVFDASVEVRSAVVFATFIVALVFLPVLMLTGLQGSFFAPLALSYLIAIMASLLVALTVTPALCLLLFASGAKAAREPLLQRMVKRVYSPVLYRLLENSGWVALALVVLCVGSLYFLPQLSGEFLPEFREGHFVLQVSAAPGTSLGQMKLMGRSISEALLQHPAVATVEEQIGRAEQGEDTWGPHRSEFHVELKPVASDVEEKIADQFRAILGGFPGIRFEVMTFLGDRISETLTGETAPVVVNIFGDDLDVLDAKAKEIESVLKSVPGAADIQVKSPPGSPRVAIRLRSDRVAQLGFRPVDILETIQTSFQGSVVAQTYHGNQVTDVAVVLKDAVQRDPENLGELILRNPLGARVPLRELADVYQTTGRSTILHEGARRRQTVTGNVSNRDLAAYLAEAETRLRETIKLPAGYYLVTGGSVEATKAARKELLAHTGIAAVGILLLLAVALGNARQVLLVLLNVPFALVGGIMAVWISQHWGHGGNGLTIGSLVGFVTLFGITMRNSIMLISHYEHLVRVDKLPWNANTALLGASERVIPILMTALVTALGLLPLAINSGEAGREIEGPMALVILGGLVTSTLLNILVLPVLSLKIAKLEPGS